MISNGTDAAAVVVAVAEVADAPDIARASDQHNSKIAQALKVRQYGAAAS